MFLIKKSVTMSKFKGGGGNYKLDLKKKNYERHLISYNKEIIGALCFNKKKRNCIF